MRVAASTAVRTTVLVVRFLMAVRLVFMMITGDLPAFRPLGSVQTLAGFLQKSRATDRIRTDPTTLATSHATADITVT